MLQKPSLYHSICAVLKKDGLTEMRSHYAFSMLIVFAVTVLSSLSMSIGGAKLNPQLTAALLWVILFFSAMAGLSRVFAQEQDAGTLTTLKLYSIPQGVYWGKAIFNILLLTGLSLILLPLFIVFFDITLYRPLILLSVIILGVSGIASISTITAAMSAQLQGRSALFTILTFPLILPQFLTAIQLTASVFAGQAISHVYFIFLGGYDAVALLVGSILFDYLWME